MSDKEVPLIERFGGTIHRTEVAKAPLLILRTGPMGSGKSERTLADARRFRDFGDVNVRFFTHGSDVKGAGSVRSRTGASEKAIAVISAAELYEGARKTRDSLRPNVVVLDEVLFFGPDIVPITDRLLNEGEVLLYASISENFRGETFPSLISLIEQQKAKGRLRLHFYTGFCQVRNGRVCRNQSTDTMRVYRAPGTDGVKFSHAGRVYDQGWRAAPYYDPLYVPLTAENPDQIKEGDAFYLSVCTEHHPLPGREDTFEVMTALREGPKSIQELENLLPSSPRLPAILNALIDSRYIGGFVFDSSSGLYQQAQ